MDNRGEGAMREGASGGEQAGGTESAAAEPAEPNPGENLGARLHATIGGGKDRSRPSGLVSAKHGLIALAYYLAYLAWLFWKPESEFAHWATMVAIPLAIATVTLPRGRRGLKSALTSVGLRRGNLRAGIGWALLAGAALTAFQVYEGGNAAAIREMIRTGRAYWLFPVTFLLMMGLAGFTEEFLFRGFLQTRLEKLLHTRWGAMLVTALLFGVYHLPYAYLNPHWRSHGDWGAAWSAAMGNGVPGGILLGSLYIVSRGNLLACIILHSLINAAPAMTMIHFGAGG